MGAKMEQTTKHSGRYVAYYRISKNGNNSYTGLSVETQRESVKRFLDGGKWKLIDEFPETESGRKSSRPELDKALALCKAQSATLVVAKLDRLARNVAFISKLM